MPLQSEITIGIVMELTILVDVVKTGSLLEILVLAQNPGKFPTRYYCQNMSKHYYLQYLYQQVE